MADRLAVLLVAALLVLAGCSQLASAPNEPTETTTPAGADDATPAPSTTPNASPTTTGATPAATGATRRRATTTGGPTSDAAPAPTATPIGTPSPTATPTTTATATATPTPESHFVVVIGGSPEAKVTYEFSVTGTIERRGRSYGAPIDDDAVTRDPDIDVIASDRSSVAGRLGGGGDAYRITGEITDFEVADEDAVYVDGERIEIDD